MTLPVRVAVPNGGCVDDVTRSAVLSPSGSLSFAVTSTLTDSPTSIVARSIRAIGSLLVVARSRTEMMIAAESRRFCEFVTSYEQRNAPDRPGGGSNRT